MNAILSDVIEYTNGKYAEEYIPTPKQVYHEWE